MALPVTPAPRDLKARRVSATSPSMPSRPQSLFPIQSRFRRAGLCSSSMIPLSPSVTSLQPGWCGLGAERARLGLRARKAIKAPKVTKAPRDLLAPKDSKASQVSPDRMASSVSQATALLQDLPGQSALLGLTTSPPDPPDLPVLLGPRSPRTQRTQGSSWTRRWPWPRRPSRSRGRCRC